MAEVLLRRASAQRAAPTWRHRIQVEAGVRPAVMRLAARYLLRERRRGAALDPVANFHLRNGARNATGQGPCPVATSSLRPADGSDARASAVVLVKGALHSELNNQRW